jgi:5-methylcytosine-specific restriction endonuclease McrA
MVNYNHEVFILICKHCKKDKPESEFYNDKSKPNGKKPRCKKCDKLSMNVENRRVYEAKYWADPERAKKKKAQVKNSMIKNKEQYAEKRREYLKTDAGISMYRKQTQKRYAMKKSAFVEDVNPIDLYHEQSGICYICGKEFTFKEMELDHIHPIAKGGLHKKDNCKMACRHCNRSKGSKSLEEMIYQMG